LFQLRPHVDPEILVRRVRLILYVSLGVLTLFALSDVFISPAKILQLWALKLPVYLWNGLMLAALSRGLTVEKTILVGLATVTANISASAVSGIFTGDAVSTQMLCMAALLTTALGVPWGGRAQAVAAILAIAAMTANAWVVGEIGYAFVASLTTICASVLIGDRLRASHEVQHALRQELEESERFIRNVTDQLPALIAYVDTQERYRFINRAQAEWARLRRAEILGKRIGDIADPSIHALLAPHIRTALDGRRSTFELVDVRSPADEPRSLAAVLEPDIGADGAVRGFFCLLSDITERRHAEESARRQQAELAHVLRVSTMGEMTAALAHELNQPLAAIAAYAATCAAWAEAGPTAAGEVRAAANLVADEAVRAGEIIRRLERLIRKVPPRCDRVEPAELIAHAVALVRAEARSAGIRIESDVGKTLPAIHVDAIQIEQVLINLLLNAIQALERSDAQPQAIRIDAKECSDGSLRIVIRDNGPGIPRELRDRIFEPYFTTRNEGLGMGLAISRSIVESHEGRLYLDETTGNEDGAAFVLELPIRRAERAAAGGAGSA
jgi:PAS domain S-box-containing protein